jgi:hypothetical protein
MAECIVNLVVICIMAECIVNLVVICIISPKPKEPSKLLEGDLISHSLSHPMKISCVPPLFNIQGVIELSNYLIIPIILERNDIPQVFSSTSSHYLIRDPVMLSFHVGLVNPLRKCHRLGLGNDDRLIEVLLKCVNVGFHLNKPWIFLSLFPHQVYLALVVDLLLPIRI